MTGTRVVVFPFEPDWNEKVVERAQYLTQIIAGRSSKEQRIQMRKRPRPVHAFSVFTTDAAETAALTALLAGWQGRIFGVPVWPDMQPLAAALEAGALAVSVSTELRAFSRARNGGDLARLPHLRGYQYLGGGGGRPDAVVADRASVAR